MHLSSPQSFHAGASRQRRHGLAPLAVILVSLLVACGKAPEPPAPEVPDPVIKGTSLSFPEGHPQLALLAVVEATPGKPIAVDMPARLVWNEEKTQRIYPAFSGRVQSIRADVGQSVRSGSPLALLASPDFGSAQADTARAEADVALTRKTLARQRELVELGILARKELDQAEADAVRAQAEASRAAARTQLYGSGSSVNQQMALTTGISGLVVERNLNPGQELRPDQSGPGIPALFVISDPTSLWVQIDAREAEAAALKRGSSFELTVPALPGQKFSGQVQAVSDFIDPSTRTIKVRGLVPNPGRTLKAEMLATVRIERSLGDGVIVPASAVLLFGAKHRVYVQTGTGTFEPREVSLGHEGPKEVLVTSGLKAGEMVVSENTLLLARQLRAARGAAKPVAAKP